MLAQNFKTPSDLGLTDKQHGALVTVLGMLERGEIEADKFDMNSIGRPRSWSEHDCGTPACICGWATYVARDEALFSLESATEIVKLPRQLRSLFRLFMAGPDLEADLKSELWARVLRTTTTQAARALRNYLTHGEPRRAEALAA